MKRIINANDWINFVQKKEQFANIFVLFVPMKIAACICQLLVICLLLFRRLPARADSHLFPRDWLTLACNQLTACPPTSSIQSVNPPTSSITYHPLFIWLLQSFNWPPSHILLKYHPIFIPILIQSPIWKGFSSLQKTKDYLKLLKFRIFITTVNCALNSNHVIVFFCFRNLYQQRP